MILMIKNKLKRRIYYMSEQNDVLFNNLNRYYSKLVDTNITLDNFGINGEDFETEAKEILMNNIQNIASKRLENNNDE